MQGIQYSKVFDSEDDTIIDVVDNTFVINRFFQTGEELIYNPIGSGTTMNIGIATTSFDGIGVTDKLPSTVFAVKVAENKFKLEDCEALQTVPKVIDITSRCWNNSILYCKKS